MANIIEQLNEKLIDKYIPGVQDDPTLTALIDEHNFQISAVVNGLSHATMIYILIKKNIITEDEYNTAMQELFETSYAPAITLINRHYEQLMSFINTKNK